MKNTGPTAPDSAGEAKPVLECIARFSGPIGHLNKLGIKVPGVFAISIKRKSPYSRVWYVTWVETVRAFEDAHGEELSSEMYHTLRAEVESYFATKVTDWQEFTA